MLLLALLIVYESAAPLGRPLLYEGELEPGAIEVRAGSSVLPAKSERRLNRVRVSWLSTGAGRYSITAGSEASPEPAMIGTGDRLTFGRPGVRGKLSVGLWGHPGAIDMDDDGDLDLIVGCVDRPYNGTYLFRNLGGYFSRAEWIGQGVKDLVIADFNGDGKLDMVKSGGYYSDFKANRMSRWVPVDVRRDYTTGRDDLWYPTDWDADGVIDLLVGASDWRDYGWDDAWDKNGRWTRGPVHGYVYFHRNMGTNAAPRFSEPVKLPLETRGSPSPTRLASGDLILGDFVDMVYRWSRSTGRMEPLFQMELCMIQPRVVDWGGTESLLVGEEDGTVKLALGLKDPKPLEQIDPYIKSGALARPVAVDWNGDGLLDIITGNSAGYLQYFQNAGTKARPEFTDRGNLTAGGKTIRRIAGPNGSVQGPIEEKWGYSNPSVADWDLDGKLDIVVNDIWGAVHWYKGAGGGDLEPARNIEVQWEDGPPKPDWVWWKPVGNQLVTQWRTTPKVVDWDRDGLPDLVMMDWRGYLALYRRARVNGQLLLMPPERIFVEPGGRFLLLATGRGGSSGRKKVEIVDWDGDGDLDLITNSNDGAMWYENIGSQSKPIMARRGEITNRKLSGHDPTPNAADWNGDGRLDLLIGAEDGFLYYFDRAFLDGR
ncbi:MAG: VCBS repeat-containing protein [Bryobacterales bacterium]|nr:VCBS repeat-containing protein [Bryobacterales bacterium]